jgi:hypothetical protein
MVNQRPSRLYGLSFVPHKARSCRPPQLVLVTPVAIAQVVQEILSVRPTNDLVDADSYLKSGYTASWSPTLLNHLYPEEFRGKFGYGYCCALELEDDEVRFVFPLVRELAHEIVLTLHALFRAFWSFEGQMERVGESVSSNHLQLMMLTTRCELNSPAGWGHMVNGFMYPALTTYLARLESDDQRQALEKSVTLALTQTALALQPQQDMSKRDTRKYIEDYCGVRIESDGRFIMGCPGDACDIAIYPDSYYGPDEISNLGCHNLDTSIQQLILLSGLAALHDAVTAEIG